MIKTPEEFDHKPPEFRLLDKTLNQNTQTETRHTRLTD